MYVYDDGSTLNPVHQGVLTLDPDAGDKELIFYKSSRDGSLRPLHDGMISVEFTDGIYDKPDVSIEETSDGAVITVRPAKYSHIYSDIRGRKNGAVEEITGEHEFLLSDEGIYSLSFYSEDGLGHRTYADTEPYMIIDKTPPVIDRHELGTYISGTPLKIALNAYDDISGLQGIYIREGDGEAVQADHIEISAPFRGTVHYYAVDNMGNATDEICLGEEIIVDDTPPEITLGASDMTDKSLELKIEAADDTAGIDEITVTRSGKTLYRGFGSSAVFGLDISDMPYGSREYLVSAVDRAGNNTVRSLAVTKEDGTAPEITIKGASDQMIYGNDVTVTLDASDDSGEECSIEETVTRYSLSGSYLGESRESRTSLTFDRTGIYLLTAEAADGSGNKTTKSIAFAIDKDAPVIRGLLGLGDSRLKSFMLDLTEDVAADDSLFTSRILLNGLDYEGEAITKAGSYALQVIAADEFGNASSEDVRFEISNQ